jgi:predicted nucleic acid-binding protein
MRAVIDTNVLVSALINRKGSPGLVLDKIRALALTPEVVAKLATRTELLL